MNVDTKKMKLKITIPTLAVHDTIVSGIGRIRHWAEVLRWRMPESRPSALADTAPPRVILDLRDHETGIVYSLQHKNG